MRSKMDTANLDKLGAPSRFELKNRSVELAASHAERVMLNARREPNSAAS
jgi:hypothetical protein